MYEVVTKIFREGKEDYEVDIFDTKEEVESYKRMRRYLVEGRTDIKLIGFDIKEVVNEPLSCEVNKKQAKVLKLYLKAIGVTFESSECYNHIVFNIDAVTLLQKLEVEDFLKALY